MFETTFVVHYIDDESGINGEQIEVGEDERDVRKRFPLVNKLLNRSRTITKVKHQYSKADWKFHEEMAKKFGLNK